MTAFSYKALTADGRKTVGTIEAATRKEASQVLRSRGVHVTTISAAGGTAVRLSKGVSARSASQAYLFTSFMRRLLRAGMPVVEALDASAEELAGQSIGAVIARMSGRVAGGSSLAEAFSAEKDFFDDLYVAMVRAAEVGGDLAGAFDTIYHYQRRRQLLRRRVFSALAYPIVLITVSVVAVAFLLGFVVPKIKETLIATRVELPMVTKIVIGAGDFVKAWWPLLVAAVVLVALLPRIMRSFPGGRRTFDRWLVSVPVVRRLVRSAAVGRFSRTLGALLKSGLRVADALETAGGVANNSVYEEAVAQARSSILGGGELAAALKESSLFPGYALQIVAIGEKTGSLAESFEDVALSEEESLETLLDRALTLLEPIIIVIMAVVVGFIVASVLLPILAMSNIA